MKAKRSKEEYLFEQPIIKCIADLTLNEASQKLQGHPLIIQTFIPLSVALALLMI